MYFSTRRQHGSTWQAELHPYGQSLLSNHGNTTARPLFVFILPLRHSSPRPSKLKYAQSVAMHFDTISDALTEFQTRLERSESSIHLSIFFMKKISCDSYFPSIIQYVLYRMYKVL
jgi:hypothetical protein